LFDYFRQQDIIERGYQAVWEIYTLTYPPTVSASAAAEEGRGLRRTFHDQPLSLPNIGYHIIVGEESLKVARALMNVTTASIITNDLYHRLFSHNNSLVVETARLLTIDDNDDDMTPLAAHATVLFVQLYLQIADIYTGSSSSSSSSSSSGSLLKEPPHQTGRTMGDSPPATATALQELQEQLSAVGYRLLLSYPNHFTALLIK